MIYQQNKFYLLNFMCIVLINVCNSSSALYIYQYPYYNFQARIHHTQLMDKLDDIEINEKLQTAINLAQDLHMKIEAKYHLSEPKIFKLHTNKFKLILENLIQIRLKSLHNKLSPMGPILFTGSCILGLLLALKLSDEHAQLNNLQQWSTVAKIIAGTTGVIGFLSLLSFYHSYKAKQITKTSNLIFDRLGSDYDPNSILTFINLYYNEIFKILDQMSFVNTHFIDCRDQLNQDKNKLIRAIS